MCIRNNSLAKQNVSRVSLSVLTFRIPVMCKDMHHFAGCLVASYPRKLFSLQLLESSHTLSLSLSLSLSQPLQLNPTINTRYNRLNKITIKFGTKLKPTKHIIVNYNFTNHSKQMYEMNLGGADSVY